MYMETIYPDLIHGFNSKQKLQRFCNSIPDGISYAKKTLLFYHGCIIHGDLFREKTCPILSCKATPRTANPFGVDYVEMHMKFEALKASILKKYAGIIDHIEVMYSCDFQALKRTTLKQFIENLPLPPKKRLIPRDAVRGGRCDTFVTSADCSKEKQLFYKDAS